MDSPILGTQGTAVSFKDQEGDAQVSSSGWWWLVLVGILRAQLMIKLASSSDVMPQDLKIPSLDAKPSDATWEKWNSSNLIQHVRLLTTICLTIAGGI